MPALQRNRVSVSCFALSFRERVRGAQSASVPTILMTAGGHGASAPLPTLGLEFQTASARGGPKLSLPATNAKRLRKGATRRSNPFFSSYPAKAGYPVHCGFSIQSRMSLEYWIVHFRGR